MLGASARSSVVWPTSGSMRSGCCTPRARTSGDPAFLTAARPTSASASTSSRRGPWPTPCARDGDGEHGPTYDTQAWANKRERGYVNSAGLPSDDLKSAVAKWPTPATTDAQSAGRHTTETGVMHPGTSLTDAIRMYPTPVARDAKGQDLPRRDGAPSLGEVVHRMSMYPTPKAADYGSSQNGSNSTRPSAGTPSLPTMARSGLLPRATETAGPGSSEKKPVLNPRFVEMLMGLPRGWTGCEPLETESFRRWLRAHSRHSRPASASEEEE
jgi:hypothetical protein